MKKTTENNPHRMLFTCRDDQIYGYRKIERQEVKGAKKKPIMDADTLTAFLAALASDDINVLKGMIKQNIDLNKSDRAGRTPLHWACYYVNPGIMQVLLDNGADVNAVNNIERTPLHLAVILDRPDLADILLAHGADPNARDNNKETALDLALRLYEEDDTYEGDDTFVRLFRKYAPERA